MTYQHIDRLTGRNHVTDEGRAIVSVSHDPTDNQSHAQDVVLVPDTRGRELSDGPGGSTILECHAPEFNIYTVEQNGYCTAPLDSHASLTAELSKPAPSPGTRDTSAERAPFPATSEVHNLFSSGDPSSSLVVLLDTFDAFMEAWAAHATPVPPYFWENIQECPFKQSVHPARAAELLASRSYVHQDQERTQAAAVMEVLSKENPHQAHLVTLCNSDIPGMLRMSDTATEDHHAMDLSVIKVHDRCEQSHTRPLQLQQHR